MTQNKEVGWNFDNSYARLPELFFKSIEPTPVRTPELVTFNKSLAKSLGLDVKKLQSKEGIEVLAGNQIPEGALPIAPGLCGSSVRELYHVRGRAGCAARRADHPFR